MNRLKIKFFCLVLLLPGSLTLVAQVNPSATATGSVFAEVIPVFTAIETSQLNFGKFSPGSLGGEIILTPEGTISVMGSVHQGTGLYNPGSFYISGDPDSFFTITLPATEVKLQHSMSDKTMTLDNWMSTPGVGVGEGILKEGEQTVYIGATLKVGPIYDNPVGVYSGTYTVTFDFN
ncbi:MAG TPA: DUF4402 domain-containing protein [Bacteroidales bacterium]|nr:DUF4402 domain-containing protein [Bacteroidales bacterium]